MKDYFGGFHAVLAIVLTVVVFYVCFQAGLKRHSQHHDACPTPFPIKQDQYIAPAVSIALEPCTHTDNVCHNFANQKLSTLKLAKATAPEDLFPHLKHPSSPAKWSFYMSQSSWKAKKVLESPCEQMYLTRTGCKYVPVHKPFLS